MIYLLFFPSSSSLSSSSPFFLFLFLLLSFLPPPLLIYSLPHPNSQFSIPLPILLIQSIRVGSSLCLFIFYHSQSFQYSSFLPLLFPISLSFSFPSILLSFPSSTIFLLLPFRPSIIFPSSSHSLPFFSLPQSDLSSFTILPVLSSISHLIHSFPFSFPILNLSSSFKVYVSAFGYPYLYSRLIFPKLTPHVLSEWMVEVCAGDLYPVGLCLCFVLVLTRGGIYYILYIYYYTLLYYY